MRRTGRWGGACVYNLVETVKKQKGLLQRTKRGINEKLFRTGSINRG